MSKEAAKSGHGQKLTTAQEEVLVERINYCADRGIHSTPQFVKNFAEEIIEAPIAKDWVTRFIKRHQHRIRSMYLQPIDRHTPAYQHFYTSCVAETHSIDQHNSRGLHTTLRQDKKRRQRGKRLDLNGKEDSRAQFLGPEQVQAAQDHQASEQQEEEQRKQDIVDRKVLAAIKKTQKEKEMVERAAVTTEKRKAAAEARFIKEVEKRARAEAKAEVSRQKEKSRLRGQSTGSKEARETLGKQARRSIPVVVTQEVKEVVMVTSRGRQVHKPRRFLF